MLIVHVASIKPNKTSGMGRISYYWEQAFIQNGCKFIHVGWDEIGKKVHPLLFGWYVRRYIKKSKIRPDIILAHEPYGGFLKFNDVPLIVFSHGIEEVGWRVRKQFQYEIFSFKSLLIPNFLRFLSNNIGFNKASLILLSNKSDQEYLIKKKRVQKSKIALFRNGYTLFKQGAKNVSNTPFVVLFNGSWIKRKGISLLLTWFEQMVKYNKLIILRLAGIGIKKDVIKDFFSCQAFKQVEVIESFNEDTEWMIYENVSVFVQPSYFEGKSLALIQAMFMGICPVAADNSGQIDLIQHGHNGLTFKTGDITDFSYQMDLLIQNTTFRQQLSAAAKSAVQYYNWEVVSNDVVKKVVANINAK